MFYIILDQTNCIVLTNIIDLMFNIFEINILMTSDLSTIFHCTLVQFQIDRRLQKECNSENKHMDVYLQPLIDELKEIREGIHLYYVSRPIPIERNFTVYGICVYTKHEHSGLGFFYGKYVLWFVYIHSNISWKI